MSRPSTGTSEGLARVRAALGDRYEVERVLGHGAAATVYLARDPRHGRYVALKVMHPELSHALVAERFLREIGIAASLSHLHILSLHDSGEADGLLYYVTPFADGGSLRDRLAREVQLPVAEAVRIAREVSEALAYAHERGVVHRDVKPENILLQGGRALLADFGIARALQDAAPERLTASGLAVGTPTYMSPEQCAAEREIDGRSDIYALGCVLYEMLAGEPPFTGPTAQVVMARRMSGRVPSVRDVRQGTPPTLDAIIRRALALVPADRYQTVGELTAALAAAGHAGDGPTAQAAPRRWRSARTRVLAAAGLLAVGAAVVTARAAWRARPAVVPAAAVIAIMPFAPPAPDTALGRLGRELAITLAANLDGVGGIRAVDALTVLAHVTASSGAPSLVEARALAGRLGASSVIHGSVLRAGDLARVDLALYPLDAAEPIARATVSAASDDIAALTDSATWALLRQVWQRSAPPTPSLGAVTTRSIAALRAFLDGERLIVEGRWRAAPDAYQRAIALDSTFWLAHWRYALARGYWVEPVDPAITAAYRAHRDEFPERDRLLIEAEMADSASVRYRRTRLAAERYPDNWLAWWALSEVLAHVTPLLGTSDADLRAALERTVELNPRMTSAWNHLFWVAAWQRDTLLAEHVLRTLTALRYDSVSLAETRIDALALFRTVDASIRSGGGIADPAHVEAGVRLFAGWRGPVDPYGWGVGITFHGLPRAQAEFVAALLARGPPPAMAAAQQLALAVANAERGAWDSALVALDAFAAGTDDPVAPLYRYRVAVVGAWLGALEPRVAATTRVAAARGSARLTPASRAELAWLDGLLAAAQGDTGGLAAARRALRVADTVTAPLLDRSLGAFRVALAGDRRRAADSLVALERERAELGGSRWRSDPHPFVTGIDRLAAARWLRETGAPAEALPLLTWHQAVLFPLTHTRQANLMLEGPAYLEQARAAELLGQHARARTAYQRFLWRYDAPVARHRHLVDEAVEALARLGRGAVSPRR